jgi:dihydroxyacetone kinase
VSAPPLARYVEAAAGAVEASRDELCRLDAVAGDGDHGVTMALAARAVRAKVEESPDGDVPALLMKIALGVGSVGGAIGPIYASGVLGIAATVRSWGSEPAPLTVRRLRECAEAAENAIVALGHAKVGDKTILDALDPLVVALHEAEAAGTPVSVALDEAAQAARDGAASTAGMIATLGRAARLGERSRGSADPGASSFALIIGALVDASRAATGEDAI